jgi:hypothetical protein
LVNGSNTGKNNGNWYGMLFHEGQFLDPVMRNIETFLEDTQKNSKWNGNGNIETVSLYMTELNLIMI